MARLPSAVFAEVLPIEFSPEHESDECRRDRQREKVELRAGGRLDDAAIRPLGRERRLVGFG